MPTPSYLVELRIGYPRYRLAEHIETVAKSFNLGVESPQVPHMSLFGSFKLKSNYNFRDLRHEIEKAAKKHDRMSYIVNGWDYRKSEGGGVIAFKVEPSIEFRQLVIEMVHNLLKISQPKNAWDYNPESAWFHITLAFRLNEKKYDQILKYLGEDSSSPNVGILNRIFSYISQGQGIPKKIKRQITPLFLPIDGLRITIIRGNLIAAEYDLVTKRWLNRPEAKSIHNLGTTLRKYRINQGIELINTNYSNSQTIYVLSDLHLGHANIIKYCSRPFLHSNVREMDRVLITNWNNTVKNNDFVYYLGDLSLNNGHSSPIADFHRLNGQIKFVQGNHDGSLSFAKEEIYFNYHGIDFLFIHDPKIIPLDFHGWAVHGHVHNNHLKQYPFFDPQNRRINVGVELIKYQPLRLKYLYDLITNHHGRIEYLI